MLPYKINPCRLTLSASFSYFVAVTGANAHKLALAAGVTVSGCTVHFVEAEVDAGGIVLQQAVPVLRDDTEATLSERVKVRYPFLSWLTITHIPHFAISLVSLSSSLSSLTHSHFHSLSLLLSLSL